MSIDATSGSSHEAFVRALTKHERVVRAYIRGAGIARPEDVDEIMQEVSLIAWEKFDQLMEVAEFPKWACVIARYRVLEFRRQKFRDRLVLSEKVFDLLMEEALEESGQREGRLRQLERCLESLPVAGRKLVMAAYNLARPSTIWPAHKGRRRMRSINNFGGCERSWRNVWMRVGREERFHDEQRP